MKKYLWMLPLLCIFFSFNIKDVLTSTKTTLYAEETDGKTIETISKETKKRQSIQVEEKNEKETVTFTCTTSYIIKQYSLENTSEDSNYSYSRTDGTIHCGGKVKGKTMEKTLQIGRNKWIQNFGYGLRPFMKSSAKKWYFSSINPNDFSLVSMVAIKENIEELTLDGTTYQAQKIKITLTGMKSMFWDAEIWFDTKTFISLKYVGNEGPSTPTTTITYKAKK